MSDVAKYRGMDTKVFEETEAGVYKVKDVKGTLVDHVMTLDELMNDLTNGG